MSDKITRIVVLTVAFFTGLLPYYLFAANPSSANFQIEQGTTTVPMRGNVSSGTYKVDSSISPIIGNATSASFIINNNETQPAGATPVVPVTPPPSGGGGGGGGGGVPPSSTTGSATISVDTTCPIYRSSTILDGVKTEETTAIEINGSREGIEFPNITTWIKGIQPLVLGNNLLQIVGIAGSNRGTAKEYTLIRRFPGDINGNGRVDDFDLSILVSKWETNYCPADFNRSKRVDDFDLSILVSAWTQ